MAPSVLARRTALKLLNSNGLSGAFYSGQVVGNGQMRCSARLTPVVSQWYRYVFSAAINSSSSSSPLSSSSSSPSSFTSSSPSSSTSSSGSSSTSSSRSSPPSSSFTLPINHKASRSRKGALPEVESVSPPAFFMPSKWSIPAAVSSIIYEMPSPASTPPKTHILNCLVQNEPGVLSRVAGVLTARDFNIDSLVVCKTEVENLSRMTIVLSGQDDLIEQARRQVEDLVPVWAVLDYTDAPLIQRELFLAKVSILGPKYFEELLAYHRRKAMFTSEDYVEGERKKNTKKKTDNASQSTNDHSDSSTSNSEPHTLATDQNSIGSSSGNALSSFSTNTSAPMHDFHLENPEASYALYDRTQNIQAITYFTHQFGGKVLDISKTNCIVELSAKPHRIDNFLHLIQPFGILESSRAGLMALTRSPLVRNNSEKNKDAEDIVDQSTLPPG